MYPSWLHRRDRAEPLLGRGVRWFAAVWALTVALSLAAVVLAERTTATYRDDGALAAGPGHSVQAELAGLRQSVAAQENAALARRLTHDPGQAASFSRQSRAALRSENGLAAAAGELGVPTPAQMAALRSALAGWQQTAAAAVENPAGLSTSALAGRAQALDHRLAGLQDAAASAAAAREQGAWSRARTLLAAAFAAILLLCLVGLRFLRRARRLGASTRARRQRQARWNEQVEAVLAWAGRARDVSTRSQLIGFAHSAPADAIGATCLAVAEGAPPPHRSHGRPRFSIEVDDAGEGLQLSLCFAEGRGDDLDQHALSILIGHLSALWRAVLRQEELERAAGHDALTGLPNRRLFEAELRRRVAVHGRRGLPFTLAILDLDHFKAVNDVLGHPEGDAVLRRTASALDGCLRASDRVFRLGGEEFALLLETGDAEGVRELLERSREEIKALAVEPSPGKRLSASIGWAVFPQDAGERSELVAVADAALYAAKNGGRDRVVRADTARASAA